jgi:hypothetical protein
MKRMEHLKLDMSIFEGEDPWEACFRLAEFFERGGICKLNDGFNWVGAAFTCSRKANDILSKETKMAQRLAWAYLAISINESLGEIGKAMLDRASMIIRFGTQPGDYICDLDKVVTFFLTGPNVQIALGEDPVVRRRIRDLHSGVRIAAEELKSLVSAGRLMRAGEIDRLISLVENAVP